MRRPNMIVPIMMTQVLTLPPVPLKLNSTSDSSSLKSTPFMATVTGTVSTEISEGSSWIFGVRQRMVVLLR